MNFEVGDFTAAELAKMSSFGVPSVTLVWVTAPGGRLSGQIAINQIGKRFDATFDTEQEAKKYEEGVLTQIRTAMQRLRESKDDFSSTEEVEF